MKKFIVNSLLFALVLFSFLYLADAFITKGLKKNTSNVYLDWNNIFNGQINSNLIINGSSIAEVQISPYILDSILNTKSYNFGMSGFSFLMQKAKYDVYLENNEQPEIIIQIVGDGTFTKKEGLFQLTQFLPYLDNKTIRNTTKQYKGLDFTDYNIPLFKYSGEIETSIKGASSFFDYEFLTNNRYKGYASNDFEWDNKFDSFKKDNPKGKKMITSKAMKDLFDLYINEENQKGTQIFIVFPPTYEELDKYIINRDEIISYYRTISDKYSVIFLDYSNSEFSKRKELFYNANHLNTKGAELFSKRLALDLNERIHNN